MNFTLFEKFSVLFKYLFSSFLSIEMFILSVLLFVILLVNIKRNNLLVQMIAIGVYIGFVIGILISYSTYVQTCVDSFVKAIMNYVYFPSTIVYFFFILFGSFMILYTLFSKKITNFKRIFNYLFFSILYYFFMSFIALATYDGVDLVDTASLYKNDTILCIVQVSNLLLVIWILFTLGYHLYNYLKEKYD